jgi:hypothetical protein
LRAEEQQEDDEQVDDHRHDPAPVLGRAQPVRVLDRRGRLARRAPGWRFEQSPATRRLVVDDLHVVCVDGLGLAVVAARLALRVVAPPLVRVGQDVPRAVQPRGLLARAVGALRLQFGATLPVALADLARRGRRVDAEELVVVVGRCRHEPSCSRR